MVLPGVQTHALFEQLWSGMVRTHFNLPRNVGWLAAELNPGTLTLWQQSSPRAQTRRPPNRERHISSHIARLMGPTWGPPGGDRTQVGPMLAPWILLSGLEQKSKSQWRTLWGGDGLNTSGLRDWRDVCLALDVIIVLGIYFGVELHSCKIVTCNYQSMSRLQRQFTETAVEFRTWVRNCIRHETTDAIIHLLPNLS